MRSALGLLIFFQTFVSVFSEANDFICQLTLVESSVRQPYSGRRCVETLKYKTIIQIAYVLNSSYYCPEAGVCNCNTTNKSTIPRSKNNMSIACSTLTKSLVTVKCNCCEGFQEDRFNACIPIKSTTATTTSATTTTTTTLFDPEDMNVFTFSLPRKEVITDTETQSTTGLMDTKDTNDTNEHPPFFIVGLLLLFLLLPLFLLTIFLCCYFYPAGICAKELKHSKNHVDGRMDGVTNDAKVRIGGAENYYEELGKEADVIKVAKDGDCFDRCPGNVYSDAGSQVKQLSHDGDELVKIMKSEKEFDELKGQEVKGHEENVYEEVVLI